MYSIREIFMNLRYSIGFLSCDKQLSVVKNLIYTLQLSQADTDIAFDAAGFITVESRKIQMEY